jgi:hypothetical protein
VVVMIVVMQTMWTTAAKGGDAEDWREGRRVDRTAERKREREQIEPRNEAV